MAMHRVFDSPTDRLVYDTGHQAYVHKLLTGRGAGFDTLRQEGGLSGYPSQAESEHDIVENSHASTALSYADGLAKAYAIRGEDRHVVAVIGDGGLTGGMAWEALNNIATPTTSSWSSSSTTTAAPTARPSAASRTTSPACAPTRATSRCSTWSSIGSPRVPGVGPAVYEVLHGVKKGMKDVLAPQGLFEDLGLKYVGPIDGHDRAAMEHALARPRGSVDR